VLKVRNWASLLGCRGTEKIAFLVKRTALRLQPLALTSFVVFI